MTTRRKPGNRRKTQAAPRKRPAARNASAASRKRQPVRAARKSKSSKRTSAPVRRNEPATFPAECTIAQADELKSMLEPMLSSPERVTLDLSTVRRLDTAGLQVIVSFIRTRLAAGHDTECLGATDAVLTTASLLGLGELIRPGTDGRLSAQSVSHA
jgi:ABC-type transporter Mla MlaB component